MKKISAILLLLGLILVIACGDDDDDNDMGPCTEVSGAITTETRMVTDFHSISLEGVGNVLLTQGSPVSLQVTTHGALLPLIETTVTNEELQISIDGCIEGDIDRLDYVVTIPDIERLALNGAGNFDGQNDFDLDALEIDISGAGNASLSGAVGTLEIISAGAGNVSAFNLTADDCEVSIFGAGNVEITVNNTLDVTIGGAGSVSYKGQPTITSNITGAGTINDAN